MKCASYLIGIPDKPNKILPFPTKVPFDPRRSVLFSDFLRSTALFAFLLWRSKTTFRRNKALLTLIVSLGLDVLTPLFYDTLKIFE